MIDIPEVMHAVAIEGSGDKGVLEFIRQATPVPREHEVLIAVDAAGVNRPDCLQRRGLYPVPKDASPLPGLEVAGTIAAKGPATTRWQLGDRVMALTPGGGYAEFCTVHEAHCLPIPTGFTLVEAAAIPETFFTVWYNVFLRCRLQAGETFLVHGGSSGIGSTAIQLAKAFGCTVMTTAGSDEKCRFCQQLGADLAINYRLHDWLPVARDFTEKRGVDVVLDMVAGSYLPKNLSLLARDGRYCLIAFLGGSIAEVDVRPVVLKRLTVTGSTLRPQTATEKASIAASLAEHVLPLLESRRVLPIIHTTFSLDQAQAAHDLMESNQHMGKIVLTVADEQ